MEGTEERKRFLCLIIVVEKSYEFVCFIETTPYGVGKGSLRLEVKF